MKKLVLLLSTFVLLLSCATDEDANRNAAPIATFGNANLNFSNAIDGDAVQLNTVTYMNSANESYKVSELKYIISNITFIKSNGTEYSIPEANGYFLINEELSASKIVQLSNIPSGTYTSVRFGFGVDQSKYPLNGMMNFIPMAEEQGMLWSWSAGYKFLKFEGTYALPGETDENIFLVHVGSHGSTLDNYKEITVPLNNFSVREEQTTSVGLTANIDKIFNGNTDYSFADKDEIMVDPQFAPIISSNVTTIFTAQ